MCQGTARGITVYKKHTPGSNDLQGIANLVRRCGKLGTHVVIDTLCKRNTADIGLQDFFDMLGIVTNKQGAGTWITAVAIGFHGLVQHHFIALMIEFKGKFPGVGHFRQDGKG